MKKLFLISVSFVIAVAPVHSQSPRTHDLRLLPENVHWGYYDATVKPILRVSSGDTIRVETMVARGLARLRAAGVREGEIPDALKAVEEKVKERGPGAHPMTGPIWIEGAEPGDVLEIKILGFEFLHPYGVSGFIPGSGTLPDDFPYTAFKLVRFNPSSETATFAPGITLKLAPFFGSIGVAPNPLVGRISSGPPGSHTGNLDNKELVAGSTLYVPVHVPGGLLSLGDGHAMQGDGEVTLTALETSLRGTVQVTVQKGKRLIWPRAETRLVTLRWACTPTSTRRPNWRHGKWSIFLSLKGAQSRRRLRSLFSRDGPACHPTGGWHKRCSRDGREIDFYAITMKTLVE